MRSTVMTSTTITPTALGAPRFLRCDERGGGVTSSRSVTGAILPSALEEALQQRHGGGLVDNGSGLLRRPAGGSQRCRGGHRREPLVDELHGDVDELLEARRPAAGHVRRG